MSDARIRALERRVAAGDSEAKELLYQELMRTGILNPEFMADRSNIRLLQAIVPEGLMGKIIENLLIANGTRVWTHVGGNFGGWFPQHTRVDVCPRGCSIEERGFSLTSYEMRFAEASEVEDGVLYVTGTLESADDVGPADWVSCNVCNAAWPVTELDYA